MREKAEDKWPHIFQRREEWKTQSRHQAQPMHIPLSREIWQESEFLGRLIQKSLVLLLEWTSLSTGLCEPLSWTQGETSTPMVITAPSEVNTEKDSLLGSARLSQPLPDGYK